MAEPTLRRVVLTLCSACLDGEGDACNTPGCALIRNRCPYFSIRDSCDVESIDGAPFDYDTLKRARALRDHVVACDVCGDVQPCDLREAIFSCKDKAGCLARLKERRGRAGGERG